MEGGDIIPQSARIPLDEPHSKTHTKASGCRHRSSEMGSKVWKKLEMGVGDGSKETQKRRGGKEEMSERARERRQGEGKRGERK